MAGISTPNLPVSENPVELLGHDYVGTVRRTVRVPVGAIGGGGGVPGDVTELVEAVEALSAKFEETDALHVEPRDRPGDARYFFTASLSGEGRSLDPLTVGSIVTNDSGAALRIGAGSDPTVIASRMDSAIISGRVYASTWALRRKKNTSDPLGDAVEFGIAWLDRNKDLISETVVVSRSVATVDGRVSARRTFSLDQSADIAAPAGACYYRSFIRLYGTNGETDIEVLGASGSEGLPGPKGDTGDVTPAAQAARDEAVQAAADAAAAVAEFNVRDYGSRAHALTRNIPASVTHIRTAGYASAGDGGGALYKRAASEPSHAGKVQSADGAWWEIAEDEITPKMLGVLTNSALDQRAKMQDWLNVIGALSLDGYVPRGVYKLDSEISSTVSGLDIRCHPKAAFDFSAAANGAYGFTFAGAIEAFKAGSAGTFIKGTRRIRTGASTALALAVGDQIKIRSADIHDSFNTGAKHGEMNIVVGLADAAAGYINLLYPLQATYATTAEVAKVTPLTGLRWTGGRGLGAAAEQNNQKFMRLRHCTDFEIEDTGGTYFDDRVFWVEDCINWKIRNPDCRVSLRREPPCLERRHR